MVFYKGSADLFKPLEIKPIGESVYMASITAT